MAMPEAQVPPQFDLNFKMMAVKALALPVAVDAVHF